MISVDGNKVVDYVDQTMSQQLSSGVIAMYSEDANVNFDNVFEHLNKFLFLSFISFFRKISKNREELKICTFTWCKLFPRVNI